MPGRPKLQELDARIHEMGGDEFIIDKLYDGVRPKDIAEELGVSKAQLYRWRDMDSTGNRRQSWEQAVKLKAELGIEEGGEILDNLTANGKRPTTAEVQAAKEQAGWRLGMAKMIDPERWDRAAMRENTPIADLLLAALMAKGSARNIKQISAAQIPMITAEIVQETNGENSEAA